MKVSGVVRCFRNYYRLALTCCSLEDSYIMVLLGNGYSPDLDKHKTLSDLSHEPATSTGYKRQTLAGKITESEGNILYCCDDVKFLADGGDIKARYWVIYNDTHKDKPLFLLGTIAEEKKGKETVITDGNSLTIYCAQGLWGLSLG